MNYIDIHSHIIFGVDDGSKSLEQSMKYLLEIKKIGLESVVCTPHCKSGNIDKIVEIKQKYEELKKYADILDINLYLGNEVMYSDKVMKLLKRNRLLTINNSKYVLLEFKRNERAPISSILSVLEEVMENGYKVVLAHPECYINYRNIESIRKIKDTGVLLQIDATSLFNRKTKKIVKKMLKEGLADIVASDSHCTKKRSYKIFKKAYKRIKRKYGFDYANALFYENPSLVINKH